MAIKRILIADDEPLIRSVLYDTLIRKNFDITLAENGMQAIEHLQTQTFDLVISDMKMPLKTGIDVLRFAKKIDPNIIVIIMTAFGSIENAVEAMNLGAWNYLIKPFSAETIETIIEKAKEHQDLLEENRYFHQKISSSSHPSEIIAASPSMKKILKSINKIAKSNANVFINGESGTGKEVIAEAIHYSSMRSKKPYIKVNCAAITETLIESEFFGHEKGSFTGADAKKIGRFELANKGTILLDEVTEIPLSLQPKLLRAIQEKEFERVGGMLSVQVDVRIISSSNRIMKEALDKKLFREDLFYRLNVIPINIPPLRDRKEDIIPLSEHFIEKFCYENHKKIKTFSDEAKQFMLDYPWPGNIRELANIIERGVVMDFDDIIEKDHLYLDNVANKTPSFSRKTLKDIEKEHILKSLKNNNFNKTKTAKDLGISLRTLRNKLTEYKDISI